MQFAKISGENKIISAEEACMLLHASDFVCPQCGAKAILANRNGFGSPYFRTTINSRHSHNCVEFSDFDVEFDVQEPDDNKLSLGAGIACVANRVTLKIIEMFARNPKKLQTMDRRHFEELVAELFYGFGYEVELTKRTRDGGKDIIAVSNREIIKQKYIIECKRPEPGNPIRLNVVKQLHATKYDEGANKAILITTTHFTRDARVYENKHSIDLQLNDFNDLVDWLYAYLKIRNG